MKKTLIALLMVLLCAMLIISCSSDPKDESSSTTPTKTTFTVTFDVDGDTTTVASQSVNEGSKAAKPSDPSKTGYYLSAWNTADGRKFDFNKDTVTADITLTAVWKKSYNIGDVGPAGGWIFYDIDADNASGNADNLNSYDAGWKYIEAAPDDWNNGTSTGDIQLTWGPNNTTIAGGTETGIGKGKENTVNIMAVTPPEGREFTAAKICWTYSVSKDSITYSGWFLPSKDELAALYTNLAKSTSSTKKGTWKTSYGTDSYWSSSENANNYVYTIGFSNGEVSDEAIRDLSKNVRPVRYV